MGEEIFSCWTGLRRGWWARGLRAGGRARRGAARAGSGSGDPVVAVDGPGPVLFFQQVPERKTAKNRVHLDVLAANRRDEVDRLVALGALVGREFDGRTLMEDPEGNEFCVTEVR